MWTADATFGEAKYNYFKLARGDAPLRESAPTDTFQQARTRVSTLASFNASHLLPQLAIGHHRRIVATRPWRTASTAHR